MIAHTADLDCDSPMRLLRTVHWHLRDGFCGALQSLGRGLAAGPCDPDGILHLLHRLLDGCEKLHEVERGALMELSCRPDSSWANEDVLWGIGVLRRKADAVRAATCGGALLPCVRDLHGYLAVFFGELLVQLHAKEEALAQIGRTAPPNAARRCSRGLAEVIELLDLGQERTS
ncbi:MAG: hypothetical protein AVDCRST_MAG51-1473 [uncultured Ramlibacter sp.]|uniref:Uncharacterized protein n=1 Tax=uncultured Ramlibacter sp. TaxID=260755 RepID=A0A6N3IXB9_9BURK|nr:MAG: hypothetical protein AVDCRST_MAG51-1473 [uncultured Ramlibacter sp.]